MVFIDGLVCVASGAWSFACSVNRTCLLDRLGFKRCPACIFEPDMCLYATLHLNARYVSTQ